MSLHANETLSNNPTEDKEPQTLSSLNDDRGEEILQKTPSSLVEAFCRPVSDLPANLERQKRTNESFEKVQEKSTSAKSIEISKNDLLHKKTDDINKELKSTDKKLLENTNADVEAGNCGPTRRRRNVNRPKRPRVKESHDCEQKSPDINFSNGNFPDGSQIASPSTRGFVGRKLGLRSENRILSSTSDESSCGDNTLSTSRSNPLNEKPNSDKEEEKTSRGLRRMRRHRSRKLQNQQKQQQQQQNKQTENQSDNSKTSHRQRRVVDKKATSIISRNVKQISASNKYSNNEPWTRHMYIVSTQVLDDDKYSTLPPNFSPSASLYESVKNEKVIRPNDVVSSRRSKVVDAENSQLNSSRIRRKNDELQSTSVTSIIKNLPNKPNQVSENFDKSLVRKSNFERTFPNINKVAMKDLRSFFDKPNEKDDKKIEFGFSKPVPDKHVGLEKIQITTRPKRTKKENESRSKDEENFADSKKDVYETVTSTRPLVKAKKIGEHYWPKDENTEKLLSKNTTSNVEEKVLLNSTEQMKENSKVPCLHDLEKLSADVRNEKIVVCDETTINNELKVTSLTTSMPSQGSSTETLISDFREHLNSSLKVNCELNLSSLKVKEKNSVATKEIKSSTSTAIEVMSHDDNCLNSAIPEELNEPCQVAFEVVADKQSSLDSVAEGAVTEKSSVANLCVLSQRKNSVVSLSTALPKRKFGFQSESHIELNSESYEIENAIKNLNIKVEKDKGFNSEVYHNSCIENKSDIQKDTMHSDATQRLCNKSRNNRLQSSENHENVSFNSDNLNNSGMTEGSEKWIDITQDGFRGEFIDDLENAENKLHNERKDDKELSKAYNYRRVAREIDLKNPGKSLKKKSYSDPNATAVRTAGLIGKETSENISSQRPNSCSEPLLKEQADQLSELEQYRKYKSLKDEKKGVLQNYTENDLCVNNISKPVKLKKGDRFVELNPEIHEKYIEESSISSINEAFSSEMIQQEEEQFKKVYDMLTSSCQIVHHRSCSAPVQRHDFNIVQQIAKKTRRIGSIQAPSLDQLQKEGGEIGNKKCLSTSADQLHSATLPRNKKEYREDYGFEELDRLDLRKHVVKNLLETEDSYVNSLHILYENYLKPLKRPENHAVCEPKLVDAIFFQIPEIKQHHDKFFENVRNCFENWDTDAVKMGDLFMQSFNKDMLLETYTSYIKNYLNAREAITFAMQAKTAFKTFLETCQRENKEKQGLSDLLIKPVQRIPRYELIIKDLLKHTPDNHPDRDGLLVAQQEIHALSVQMNKGKKEAALLESQTRQLQEIENLVENCFGISGTSKRRFIRQDICVELKSTNNKKDRSLWLFNDILMCTTSKKARIGTIRRSSLNLWVASEQQIFDIHGKYKFLWKFPLEDVELLKGSSVVSKQANEKQIQLIQADQEILLEIEKKAEKLHLNHQILDDTVKDLLGTCRQRLAEKRTISEMFAPSLEIGISTPDGVKSFYFVFNNNDLKVNFETSFRDLKEVLTQQKNRFDPAFMKAIPISKTRNGMQFSCATPNTDTSPNKHEVWVCNTDGYVGQICFLALDPEPSQTQCITVCNAKICCIAQVPTWDRRFVSTQCFLKEISKLPLGHNRDRNNSSDNPVHRIIAWDDTDDGEESDEENTSPMSTISSRSPYSTSNSLSTFDIPQQPHNQQTNDNLMDNSHIINSCLGGGAFKKESNGSTLHGSLEDLLGENSLSDCSRLLANQGSMWLGTEDGKIKVYSTQESVRGNKHCVELQNAASVQCIIYHSSQVFIALSNGDLTIYKRDASNGQWDFDRKRTIQLGTSPYPITKMIVVGGKELWCGCQNVVRVIDIHSYILKSLFTVSQDNKRFIQCMAAYGNGVWIAMDKKAQIKLYHTTTHVVLADFDVSNAVNKMLASSDAIIRQHKAACLRITSLLVCKDLLWIGTSAGVVLTLALPNITTSTSSLSLPLIPQGLPYGHTGHVRFLTSVDLPNKDLQRSSTSKSSPIKRRHSSISNQSFRTSTALVISGGDGYEDFGISSSTESAGREDSTNHLLIWKV